MKRRITVEQLNELTEEQKQKLRDWWNPQKGDIYNTTDKRYYDEYPNQIFTVCNLSEGNVFAKEVYQEPYDWGWCTHKLSDCLPLLDIGQMIELLNPNEMEQCYIGKNGKDVLRLKINDEQIYEADNLCDALLLAVKQVLGV